MLAGLPCVRTATTPITPMPAHLMASTVRSGLWAEHSLVPDLGITGAGDMVDTVVGAMGAPTLEATDEAMPEAMDAAMPEATDAGVTDAAMLVIMPEGGTDAATPVAVDTMAEAPSAVVVITAAVAAASTVEAAAASTAAAVVDLTAVAVDTVVAVDTGN
jgi:hypothetical protein